jgi:hypothetical protein
MLVEVTIRHDANVNFFQSSDFVLQLVHLDRHLSDLIAMGLACALGRKGKLLELRLVTGAEVLLRLAVLGLALRLGLILRGLASWLWAWGNGVPLACGAASTWGGANCVLWEGRRER